MIHVNELIFLLSVTGNRVGGGGLTDCWFVEGVLTVLVCGGGH